MTSDDEVGFSETAPTSSSAEPEKPATKSLGSVKDEDIVFTDEIGGAPKAAAPGTPLADAPPNPASPPSPPQGNPTMPPGSTTGERNRAAPGVGRLSSDRVKTVSSGALEPPSRFKRTPSGSSFPEAGATTGKRSASGSGFPESGATTGKRSASGSGFPESGATTGKRSASGSGFPEAGATTSERVRAARRDEPPLEFVKPGAIFAEYKVVAKMPDPPTTVSGRLADDEPVRSWKVERQGREAVLIEHVLPPILAQAVAQRADRFTSVRSDELEPVLASGRSREGAWIIVEPRVSLRQSVREKGPVSEREGLAAVRSGARCLAVLHQRGLCHGGPSPRQILLEGGGSVRLGSPARVRPARVSLQGGSIMGDPRFAAPEVLDGQEPTALSDIYTLGLTFLFLVSGKDPVAAEETFPAFLLRVKLPGRTPDPTTLAPTLSAGAQALFRRMTAQDPSLRPSPSDLVAEIDAFLSSGKEPEVPTERRRTARLPGPVVPVPLAVLLALAGIALVISSLLIVGRSETEDPTTAYRFEIPLNGK
jgi:hypothetical protein